jgi:hypothetical protein
MTYTYTPPPEFTASLLGKTLTECFTADNEGELHFKTTEGKHYKLHHNQDCCECVSIESIVGDLSDLIGEPLLMVEEAENCPLPDGHEPPTYDSETWTFYKFATRKGYVDVRWLGSSNGYYSESVDFDEVK